MTFEDFIRAARLNHKLTTSQLAEKICMSHQWISRLESGLGLGSQAKSLLLYHWAGVLSKEEMVDGLLILANTPVPTRAPKRAPKAPKKRAKLTCPAELVELLGKEIDRSIAMKAGVSYATARQWRVERGIPPRGSRKCFHTIEELMLDGESDSQIAVKMGISRQRVNQLRARQGIPSVKKQRKVARLKEEGRMKERLEPFLNQLGKVPDATLAKEAAVSAAFVAKARRHAGIPRYNKIEKTLESVRHLMGKVSDNQLGKQLGIRPSYVTRYRNKWGIEAQHQSFSQKARIDWQKVFSLWQSGKTDQEIAKEVGATPASIGQGRSQRGWVRKSRSGFSVLRQYRSVMRQKSDEEIADRAGVCVGTVRAYRRRHNIYKGKGWKPVEEK